MSRAVRKVFSLPFWIIVHDSSIQICQHDAEVCNNRSKALIGYILCINLPAPRNPQT